MRTPVFVLLLLSLLAACSREDGASDSTKEAMPDAPPAVAPVVVEEELGGFDSAISGLAFWRHPTLPYNSLIIAATGTGLSSFTIEDGTPVETVDEPGLSGISVGYDGTGVNAQGLLAAFDTDDGQFRFYRIDNESRRLFLTPSLVIAPDRVTGFCLGRQSASAGLALHALKADTITTFHLSSGVAGVSASSVQTRPAPASFAACAVDDVDGALFAATSGGEIYRLTDGNESAFDLAGTTAPFATAPATNTVSLHVTLSGLVVGGATDECCGQVALVDGSDGHIHVFDREDGHAMGIAEIVASFDNDGVSSATVAALAYGNFGATLRDGALGIATTNDEDEPVFRLAPWRSVMSAINGPLGEPANPRDLAPAAPESIELDITPSAVQ